VIFGLVELAFVAFHGLQSVPFYDMVACVGVAQREILMSFGGIWQLGLALSTPRVEITRSPRSMVSSSATGTSRRQAVDETPWLEVNMATMLVMVQLGRVCYEDYAEILAAEMTMLNHLLCDSPYTNNISAPRIVSCRCAVLSLNGFIIPFGLAQIGSPDSLMYPAHGSTGPHSALHN
jgi:hypothetical protein